jgi:lambda repressor-like predicted transcriptional regulator
MHDGLAYPTAMAESTYQRAARDWITALMRERGFSANALAKMAGVTHTTIQRALDPGYAFETKHQTLVKISEAAKAPLPKALRRGGEPLKERDTLPRKIDELLLARFLMMTIARFIGDAFAEVHEKRIHFAAGIIATQSDAVATKVTDAERANLLSKSVRSWLQDIASSPDAPPANQEGLTRSAEFLPEFLRALAVGKD